MLISQLLCEWCRQIVLRSSAIFCDCTVLYCSLLGVYLSWVKTNETYIWFLFIMSMYIHVAETLIAAALCHRSDHKLSEIPRSPLHHEYVQLYIHVAETLIAVVLCHRSDHKAILNTTFPSSS
jgi:hypothetical protein